ncbi:hypothetical protein G9A89_012255 [Geosiphon pyriformis]|nr:hypothetical protein G9A89_012255 [Geosiphon pyriformis]
MEQNLQKNPAYKKYVSSVEKILLYFDKEVNEWADFSAFLGRLLRAFQANAKQFNVIPRKLLVGKRLAQSLNPALPPGVHQKALEVYECIFQSIGVDNLVEDLAIYSQGLFPVLQYAAMSVKPQLLGIYEKYFFPIRGKLRPVMKAFIIALLPGLDEEGSEFFDKVLSHLDFLSGTVEQSFFMQSMWLVLITSPSLRIPALNYLKRRMPKITSKEDVTVVLGDDVSLLVRAFSATLWDNNILVRRNLLILLVTNFPLKDKNVGEMMKEEDLILLMKSAVAVVLRKDMSLNRWLYTWLLGPGEGSKQQIYHFQEYAKSAIVAALRSLFFSNSSDLNTAQRPYKILISLMDKWEIGLPIVQEILIDIFLSLKTHKFSKELLPTANMFMEMIDPYTLWSKLYGQMQDQFPSHDEKGKTALDLVGFVLNFFKLDEEQIQRMHIPLFLIALLCKLQVLANSSDFIEYLPQVGTSLILAIDLLQRIPYLVFHHYENSDSELKSEQKEVLNWEASSGEQTNFYQTSDARLKFSSGMDPVKYISDFYLYGNENLASKEFEGIKGLSLLEELLKALLNFIQNASSSFIIQQHIYTDSVMSPHITAVLDRSCTLLKKISTYFNTYPFESTEVRRFITVKFFDGGWIHSLVKCCYMVNNFHIIDSALSTIVNLIVEKRIISPSLLEPKQQTRIIVDRLWSFLNPQNIMYHLRTVELIWMLQQISPAKYVETIIAEYLIQKDTIARLSSYESFAIFWRLSDDYRNISIEFSQPMFLILDTLRDENPTNRRAGETWIRCQQDCYTKLLDPLIAIICDPSITSRISEIEIDKELLEIFYYARPFNQAQVKYVFETMLTVSRVGGQGFLKALRSGTAKYEFFAECDWLSQEVPSSLNISFTELFIRVSLRYIETEMPEVLSSMSTLNEYIQIHATDLLNILLTRPELVDADLVLMIHDVVLRKMLYSIRTKRLDLQARLLHLLFSTIIIIGSSSKTNPVTHHRPSSPASSIISKRSPLIEPTISEIAPSSQQFLSDRIPRKDEKEAFGNHRAVRTPRICPSLIKVLIQALSLPSNRPLIQQWMDFILNSLPYFRQSFNTILIPLLQCMCEQLIIWKEEMEKHHEKSLATGIIDSTRTGFHTTGSDWNINIMLAGLEKTIIFCLQDGISNSMDDLDNPIDNGDFSNGSVATNEGLVPGLADSPLFTFDTSNNDVSTADQKPREYILYCVFPNIVNILLDIWAMLKKAPYSNSDSNTETDLLGKSLCVLRGKFIARIIKILDRLCKNNRSELIEAFVELWYVENSNSVDLKGEISYVGSYIIDVLKLIPNCSPQKTIISLLDSARIRSYSSQNSSRVKKPTFKNNKLSDIVILRFLEVYSDSLEANSEALIDVWPQCLAYVKDFSAQATVYKYLLPSLLRFMTVVFHKLSSGTFFKESRAQREMQDIYQRVLEYCIQIAGRSFDQFLWARRTIREDDDESNSSEPQSSISVNEHKDPEPTQSTTLLFDEKKLAMKSKEELMIDQVNQYLAKSVIPNLRRFFVLEADRIIQIMSNVMYYIIAPSLRKQQSVGISHETLDLLCEISQISSVYPKWRKEVWDIFIDNRFFVMGSAATAKWRTIIQIIMISEKERFAEILGRISTSPANTLFTSKDQESYNRALNLRRLSFIIYCGKMDQYLSQLPIVQEKLVELLKLGITELVHIEIYLCLRILLCRISNQHLSNFWPVILTELINLFGIFEKDVPPEKPEELNVFLAACKFLDLVFVLQTDEFQIYQWMFITDTWDVINHPMTRSPYAHFDKLKEKLTGGEWENADKNYLGNYFRAGSLINSFSAPSPSYGEFKRPILTMRSISHLKQIEFFVQHVNLYVYQSTFSLAEPDLPYIESLLENDLLEGDYGDNAS